VCHRFNIKASIDDVAEFFGRFHVTFSPDWLPTKDYYPLYDVLALRLDNDDNWIVEPRSWGFLHKSWKPTAKVRTRKAFQRGKINARSETIHTTWPWKLAWRQRCLLVATSFYEPSVDGGDANYNLPDHRLFALAGLWDHFEGDDGKGNQETVDSCVMLTTDANELVASTRTGRMRQPAIIADVEAATKYCSHEVTEYEQLAEILKPWPAHLMSCDKTPPKAMS